MTKKGYHGHYSRPATDVYSRKHIDRNFDRLERLYDLQKKRTRDLEARVRFLEHFLSDGPHGAVYQAFKAAQSQD